jgi:heptosyltransferase-2
MFTPALKLLKDKYPNSEIDALVMFGGVKDIYSRLPQISNIYYHDFLNKSAFESFKFVMILRKKYNITINVYPSNRKEYNIVNWLLSAKRRAAVKYLHKDFSSFGFLNNLRIPENDSIHNVDTNIKLVESIAGKIVTGELPDLIFPLQQEEMDFATQFLLSYNINKNDIVVGFHPGCSTLKNHIKRRWEPNKFAELGSRLISELNVKILVFGGPEEKKLKEEIVNRVSSENCISVITSNLAESAAVMKRCDLFITNDSSLMHVAAAMKIKVLAIIGPTNKNYISPWQTEHKIISLNLDCAPCFFYSSKPLSCTRDDLKYKCVKELRPEMVFNAAVSFFEKGKN